QRPAGVPAERRKTLRRAARRRYRRYLSDRAHLRHGAEPGLPALASVPDSVCRECTMKSLRWVSPMPCLVLAVCVSLAGCGATSARKQGMALIEDGQYEAGLARFEEGLKKYPRDTELNIALSAGHARSVKALLAEADQDRAKRDFASA